MSKKLKMFTYQCNIFIVNILNSRMVQVRPVRKERSERYKIMFMFFSYIGEMTEIDKPKKSTDKNVREKSRIKIRYKTFNPIKKSIH